MPSAEAVTPEPYTPARRHRAAHGPFVIAETGVKAMTTTGDGSAAASRSQGDPERHRAFAAARRL